MCVYVRVLILTLFILHSHDARFTERAVAHLRSIARVIFCVTSPVQRLLIVSETTSRYVISAAVFGVEQLFLEFRKLCYPARKTLLPRDNVPKSIVRATVNRQKDPRRSGKEREREKTGFSRRSSTCPMMRRTVVTRKRDVSSQFASYFLRLSRCFHAHGATFLLSANAAFVRSLAANCLVYDIPRPGNVHFTKRSLVSSRNAVVSPEDFARSHDDDDEHS